jgi:hypothetical protein
MSEHCPHIRFHADHGALLIRDGLRICFYMRHPAHEVAQAVMRSLEAYLRAVGTQALGWYVDLEGDWYLLDEQSWETTRRHLLSSSWPRIELADDPSGAPAFLFEYYGRTLDASRPFFDPRMTTAVGFWLPTEFLEAQGPSRVRELALELAAPLPFTSGHAGFCFNALTGPRKAEEELSRLCLRYPGMDMFELDSLSLRLGTQVKGPAWLTFLGQPMLSELGGGQTLRSRLTSPGTTVLPLEGERLVITLGEWPEAGDTQAGRTLPAYRELARVLEPWLYHSTGPWPSFPEEVRQRWERRFLD